MLIIKALKFTRYIIKATLITSQKVLKELTKRIEALAKGETEDHSRNDELFADS